MSRVAVGYILTTAPFMPILGRSHRAGPFTSLNSSALMATAPEELTGEAGSVVNVVRYLGISTGIAGASTLLALGIAAESGVPSITVNASTEVLVSASGNVILLLIGLGVIAAALSLRPTTPPSSRPRWLA